MERCLYPVITRPLAPIHLANTFTNRPSEVLQGVNSIRLVGAYEYPAPGDFDDLNKKANKAFSYRCRLALHGITGCECATIHADCFNLFRSICTHGNGLRRLLLATVWRQAWDGSADLRLPPEIDAFGWMQLAARVCDLPRLESIPAELTYMIWRFAYHRSALITRYQSIISLAVDSCKQDFDQRISLPLRKIAS
jgi:hypothetical protein